MRSLGYKPDPPKLAAQRQDLQAGDILGLSTPPLSASNRQYVEDVLDQGSLSSCVAHSILQNVRMSHKSKGIKQPRLGSRLFGYYLSRASHGDQTKDDGTHLRSFCEQLVRFGFCPETDWPYDPANVNKMPASAAFRAALDQAKPAPTTYRRISSVGSARIDDVKRAIAAGFGVSFGTQVSEAFVRGSLDPVVLPPMTEPIVGGHALLAVGYSTNQFDILNSWGTGWGDAGYCTFSEKYIAWDGTRDIWIVDAVPNYSE